MTQIHVVGADNIGEYSDVMQTYFRKRHEIFVEERGWKDLTSVDGLEKDRFDDEHATYLLAIDGDKLVGGQRLYPTTRPHMISEYFMALVARDLPRNAVTLEWTRYFIVRERRMGRADARLLAGIQQYCLETGIAQLTAVVEMWWLPRWQQAGFKVRPLGVPQIVEGQPTIAVVIDVSEEAHAAASALGGLRSAPFARSLTGGASYAA